MTRDKGKQELPKSLMEQLSWTFLPTSPGVPACDMDSGTARLPVPDRAAQSLADTPPSAVPDPDRETGGLAFSLFERAGKILPGHLFLLFGMCFFYHLPVTGTVLME